MGTKELIKEIQRLPVEQQMMIIKRVRRSIREKELKKRMEKAAEALLDDYRTDKELTVFTDIDFDNFYEAR